MTLIDFQNHIQLKLPFLEKSRLLIAISGGMDSVVLTHICHKLNLNFALAHCNFNLRGIESDADEDFVLELAEDLDVEVFIESFETETYAEENNLSIQMAARELRYNWFHELAEQLKFDYILTAHHADDNLETFFINLMRGTGLDGLTGIPETNGILVRPLLPFSHSQLQEFAKSKKISWRDDSSNASTKYLRNKLRHDVIPILKDINPQLIQSFQKTQEHLQETAEIVDDALVRIQKKIVHASGDIIQLDVKKLQQLSNPKVYLYQLLKAFQFTEWDDVYQLLFAQSGKFVTSKTHRLVKDRTTLILTELPIEAEISEFIWIENESEISTPFGRLSIENVTEIDETSVTSIYVNKDLLKYPLTVRKCEKGAYFYPFGLSGKKKVSKFFKDEKLSMPEKEETWLLYSDTDIVWVIGLRADNRFKVTNETNPILKISLHNET
ncbi:tRNA lysidine(34) synthetase TilS [Bizionia myxarmorum]|uniref:tRNA(Ile)-lysidine synthase n=1 Tax=Bizionia myxarmorum TaxID=291186 RepID=A0A5D0R4D8_9FLAO|nr:tRNA lysidine(34) synthetase TilS [Bizionia myxarmorum]TYB76427.1 tRNA lysidine(34) synthetase TilS [Bizionia myxarmorum]